MKERKRARLPSLRNACGSPAPDTPGLPSTGAVCDALSVRPIDDHPALPQSLTALHCMASLPPSLLFGRRNHRELLRFNLRLRFPSSVHVRLTEVWLAGILMPPDNVTRTPCRGHRHRHMRGGGVTAVIGEASPVSLLSFSPIDPSPLSSALITHLPLNTAVQISQLRPTFSLHHSNKNMHSLRDFFSRRAHQKAASTAPGSLTPDSINNSDNNEAGSPLLLFAGLPVHGKPGSTGSTLSESGGDPCAQATTPSEAPSLPEGSTSARSSFMALNMSSIGLALNNIGLPAPPTAPRFLRALSRGASANRVASAENVNKKNVSTPLLSCCSKEVAEDPCRWSLKPEKRVWSSTKKLTR